MMDQLAFVLKGKRELVFKRGSCFTEQRAGAVIEYEYAYSLVSPTSLAPMILLLSEKKPELGKAGKANDFQFSSISSSA